MLMGRTCERKRSEKRGSDSRAMMGVAKKRGESLALLVFGIGLAEHIDLPSPLHDPAEFAKALHG